MFCKNWKKYNEKIRKNKLLKEIIFQKVLTFCKNKVIFMLRKHKVQNTNIILGKKENNKVDFKF